MELDKTEIVIRQRTGVELMDLSLVVYKRHLPAILTTSALIGIPLLLVDTLAVMWMMGEDAYLTAETMDAPESYQRWRHNFHLVVLYVVQFSLISLPTTVYLGHRIFFDAMSVRNLIGRLLPIAWRCILILGLLRLGLVPLILEFLIDKSVPWDWAAEFWGVIIVSSIALLIRACWPFAPEILGLELCPLQSSSGADITYGQRSRGLHRLLVADNIARFIGAAFVGSALTGMLLGSCLFVKGTSTGDWTWNGWFDHLLLPATLWIVGTVVAVFRFLSYLDSRIRLEGWEIELRLRAEADRLLAAERGPVVSAGESQEATPV